MKTYSAIQQQATIHPAILGSFAAQGLTQQEALVQPRRAEVILRYDPFAASPYIVTLSFPALALDGLGPRHRAQAWDFATFEEARAWFDELFDANADMIVKRQQPPKRERKNTTVPWKVGDAATLSRLIPYIWLVRTQSRVDKVAGDSQNAAYEQAATPEHQVAKNEPHTSRNRSAVARRRYAVAPPTPSRHVTLVSPFPLFEMASKCETFSRSGTADSRPEVQSAL